MTQRFIILGGLLIVIILSLNVGCSCVERKLLFFPSHYDYKGAGLAPWVDQGQNIGFCRKVESPKTVWVMFHGNGGQASDREYALPSFDPQDAVYIVEYPGYGARKGVSSKKSFNQVAKEAYSLLRANYTNVPVCVVGESIGSGPAASLAGLERPPEKVVLVVPFDRLSAVAKEYYPSLVVSLLLKDDWNNVEALSNYTGKVEIFGAANDTIIPISHARALAEAVPTSKLNVIEGGHNDWSYNGKVKIRYP